MMKTRKSPIDRRAENAKVRENKILRIQEEGVHFEEKENIRAIPIIGGLLSEQHIDKDRERFDEHVMLPVSRRLAEKHRTEARVSWMVVRYEGRNVAMLPMEAEAIGLAEADEWAPGLK